MSDPRTFYRISLEYEVAESIAEQLPPDFAAETDIESLADDRFLIDEPDLVLFPTVAVPTEVDPSTLESRLAPVDLTKPAEIGITRDQVEQFGDETHVLVTIRPEFNIKRLQSEVIEYVRSVDGEVVNDIIPTIARRDIPEAYLTVNDLSAPTARPRRGLDRIKNRLADALRSDGNAMVPFGIIRSHAFVRADNPLLRVSKIDAPPSPAILP
ncbi:hypothetical protein [Halocatena marina]|uniref:hypothetical protein n=1 Tax=Halocatena marina TaxID=2934937 RepID=UPI00200E3740|nr:hypothetical protein [Halocatena marina]